LVTAQPNRKGIASLQVLERFGCRGQDLDLRSSGYEAHSTLQQNGQNRQFATLANTGVNVINSHDAIQPVRM
jgi:hypothetical protein